MAPRASLILTVLFAQSSGIAFLLQALLGPDNGLQALLIFRAGVRIEAFFGGCDIRVGLPGMPTRPDFLQR